MTSLKRLRALAKRISEEADNISPTNNVHPAPVMREWARAIEDIASQIETSN